MTFKEYIENVKITESTTEPIDISYKELGLTSRLLHGYLGIVTEAKEAEAAYDKIISAYIHSSMIDKKLIINYLEEIGDVMWYTGILADELDKMGDSCLLDVLDEYVFANSDDLVPNKCGICRFKDEFSIKDNVDNVIMHIIDNCKKTLFYKRELDNKKMVIAVISVINRMLLMLFNLINKKLVNSNIAIKNILKANIVKLQARYGDKFTNDKAINRDINNEYKILGEYILA